MLIRRNRGWEIPESQATPESIFLNRRSLIGGAAGLAAGSLIGGGARAAGEGGLYPAQRNDAYTLDRALTPEKFSGDYNNFYEFGMSKTVLPAANALKTSPWTVKIDGLVEKPFEIGVDDLIKKIGLEERLYRHRCVEAWSMAVPWTGFPCRSSSPSRSRVRARNTCASKPSWTRRPRRVSGCSTTPGRISRA